MHAVKCPKCHKILHLDRAVRQAKLKCKSCGCIFVANSVEVPGGAPPQNAPQRAPGAAQESPPAPVRRPTQQRAPGAGDPNANRPRRPQNPGEPAPQSPSSPQDQFAQGQFPPSGQAGQYGPAPQQYAAPPQYGPQYPPQYAPPPYGPPAYGPPPRQTSPVFVILMILLGVTVIGGGAFCVWHFVLRSPTAPANVARVADTPALPAQLPPAQQPVRPPADPVTRTPARAVEDPPPPPAPQPTSAPIPTGDDKIQVQALRVIPNEIRGTGDVAGEVQNSYDVALRDASVSVMLTPKEGPPITLKEVKVRYIPPRSRVPFSVPFEVDADVEDSTPANGWATGEKADEKTLCWLVSDDQCHVATPEKKRFYVLDGRVRNDSGGPVKDVIIYADFFIGHGIWKGAQGGTIDNETKTIGTNKTANFTLKFDTAAAKIVGPEAVQGQCVRVVAQKP